MSAPRPSYSTDEERLQARADSSRRYRQKQKEKLQALTPPDHSGQLAYLANRYRSQETLIDDLTTRLAKALNTIDTLRDEVASYKDFRESVVSEFERVDRQFKQLQNKVPSTPTTSPVLTARYSPVPVGLPPRQR